MKMTANGRLLLKLTGMFAATSFCTATLASDQSFVGIWMGVVSVMTALGTIICAGGCIIDTLLENEE